GGLADQMDALHVGAERPRERREVLALPRPAQDQVYRLVPVRPPRPHRRGDGRRFRIVDVADAGPPAHPRPAGAGGRGSAARRGGTPGNVRSAWAIRTSGRPSAWAAAVAAAAFSRLCAPRISGSAGRSSSAENSIPSSPLPFGTTFARARSKIRSFAARYSSKP